MVLVAYWINAVPVTLVASIVNGVVVILLRWHVIEVVEVVLVGTIVGVFCQSTRSHLCFLVLLVSNLSSFLLFSKFDVVQIIIVLSF